MPEIFKNLKRRLKDRPIIGSLVRGQVTRLRPDRPEPSEVVSLRGAR